MPAILLTAVAPVMWGTTFLVTARWLPTDHPLLVAALRALPAGLGLLLVLRRLPPRGWWGRVLVLGTLNVAGSFVGLVVASGRLPGGVAATLGALNPLAVLLLGIVVLRRRPASRQLLCGLVGVGGVAMLVLQGSTGSADVVGVLAGLAATTSLGAGILLQQRWGTPGGPWPMAAWQLTAGGLVLALLVPLEGPPVALDAEGLLAAAWMAGPVTAVAYAAWFLGVERLPGAGVAFLGLLSPVVAAALGLLVGERLTPLQLAGAALVLLSAAAGATGRLPRLAVPRALGRAPQAP